MNLEWAIIRMVSYCTYITIYANICSSTINPAYVYSVGCDVNMINLYDNLLFILPHYLQFIVWYREHNYYIILVDSKLSTKFVSNLASFFNSKYLFTIYMVRMSL